MGNNFYFLFTARKCGQLLRRACSIWWRLWVWKFRQKPCRSASMEKTGRQLPLWTYTVSWGGSGGFKKKLFFVDSVTERHLFSDDCTCLYNQDINLKKRIPKVPFLFDNGFFKALGLVGLEFVVFYDHHWFTHSQAYTAWTVFKGQQLNTTP